MPNKTLVALTFGLLVCATAAATHANNGSPATPLPYTEDFGDLQYDNCDSAWLGSVCEQGWSAMGAQGSVRMNELVEDPDADVIMITPGQGSPNGVQRSFALDPNESHVRFTAMAMPVDGSANFAMRVEFEDAQGTSLGIETEQISLPAHHNRTLFATYPIPPGAVTAVLGYFAVGGSSGTEVAVYQNGGQCKGNCHWTVDIPPTTGTFPGGEGEDCPEDAEELACECNISCGEGEMLNEVCVEVSACVFVGSCECVDDVFGECPETDAGAYTY